MKKIYPFIFFAFAAIQSQSQVTVNLTPIDDNTLYESGTGALSNGAGDDFFCGNNGSGLHRRGLIKFDISAAIPAGSTITSVSLQLTMNQSQPGANPVALHPVLANWGEGTSFAGSGGGGGTASTTNDATWIHTFFSTSFWTNPGGDFNPASSASTSVGTVGNYTWSSAQMVTDVQNWLDNPSTAFGWLLLGNESVNSTAARFVSKESASTTQRPKLTITYTPPCVNPTVPSVGASQTTVCAGTAVNLTTTGTLNSATTWELYSGTCGSTVIAQNAAGTFTVNPTTTTTYFVRGMGGCITTGACGSVTITVNPQQDASHSYLNIAYCNNHINDTPNLIGTPGGTYTSTPAGLDLNSSTGEINFLNSTTGFYTVTYTTPGPNCIDTQNSSIHVYPVYNINTTANICNGDVFQFGSQQLTTPGTYTENLLTTIGCDSVVTLTLSVTTVDTVVNQSNITLTASTATANTYKWADCNNNYALIAGANGQTFTPAVDGDYALIVTENGCTDTSGCHNVTGTGIHELTNTQFQLYPNPANEKVQISAPSFMQGERIEIYNAQGKLLFTGTLHQRISEISTATFVPGIYLVKLIAGEMAVIQKLVIE